MVHKEIADMPYVRWVSKIVDFVCMVGIFLFIDVLGGGDDVLTQEMVRNVVGVLGVLAVVVWGLLYIYKGDVLAVAVNNVIVDFGIVVLLTGVRLGLVYVVLRFFGLFEGMVPLVLLLVGVVYLSSRLSSPWFASYKPTEIVDDGLDEDGMSLIARYVYTDELKEYLKTRDSMPTGNTVSLRLDGREVRVGTDAVSVNLSFWVAFAFGVLGVLSMIAFIGLSFVVFYDLVNVTALEYVLPLICAGVFVSVCLIFGLSSIGLGFILNGLGSVVKRVMVVMCVVLSLTIMALSLSVWFVLEYTVHDPVVWSTIVVISIVAFIRVSRT